MRVDSVTPSTSAAPQAQKPSAAALHAAQAFEQLFVQQLAQYLVPDDSGDDSDSSTQSLLQQYLPDALGQALTAGGGLGVSAELAKQLDGSAK